MCTSEKLKMGRQDSLFEALVQVPLPGNGAVASPSFGPESGLPLTARERMTRTETVCRPGNTDQLKHIAQSRGRTLVHSPLLGR